MTTQYKNRYYDHFSGVISETAPVFDKRENYMMRFFAPLSDYLFENNNLTIIFFKEGCGALQWKDKRVKLGHDKFIITNPGQGWQYTNPEEKYIDVLSVVLSEELTSQFDFFQNATLEQLLDNPFDKGKEASFFLEIPLSASHYTSGMLLKKIHSLSEEQEFGMYSAEELSMEVLQRIYAEQVKAYKYANKIEAKKATTQIESLKRLFKAYEYIQDNIASPINLTELSYESSLSKHHLYESFKAVYGKTPHQYINGLKLKKSKEHLKKGEFTVGEVSDLLGFSNISVFSKVFKKAYGHSPSHYLKK